MGAKYRFSAQLTPWLEEGAAPYARPTESEHCRIYCPKELCYMSNSEFRFLANGQSRRYSYRLRGFCRP